MCFTPLLARNCLNSSEINCGPLSDTNCRGIVPVARVVVDTIGKTSGHFEWASKTTSSIFPLTGPAKSKWIRCHGWIGHSHGCSGANGVYFE